MEARLSNGCVALFNGNKSLSFLSSPPSACTNLCENVYSGKKDTKGTNPPAGGQGITKRTTRRSFLRYQEVIAWSLLLHFLEIEVVKIVTEIGQR